MKFMKFKFRACHSSDSTLWSPSICFRTDIEANNYVDSNGNKLI